MASTKQSFKPTMECLEERTVPSWSTTPPSSVNLAASGNDKISISTFDRTGNYARTSSITRNEIDYRTFTSHRTGTFTFEAMAYGSRIDTVAALYDTSGRRIAYNDDVASGNNNSKFLTQLQAGRKYVLGITNYQGSPKGQYKVVITGAPLSGSAEVGDLDYGSEGSASLRGTTLNLQLWGHTYSPWHYTDHEIEVRILDRNGRAIHTGSWVRGFRTAGTFVPGSPIDDYDYWNIDVSFLDLSRAYQLSVIVST